MPDPLLLALRLFLGGVGISALALASLLYENEEGKIQSALEDAWVRLDDSATVAVAGHRSFLGKIALMTSRILDKLLGPRLVSLHSIGVTGWLLFASFGLVFLPAAFSGGRGALISFLILFTSGSAVVWLPIWRPARRRTPFYLLAGLLFLLIFVIPLFNLSQIEDFWAMALAVIVGLVSVIVFLAFTRLVLRSMAKRSSSLAALFQAGILPASLVIFSIAAWYSRTLGPSWITWGLTGIFRKAAFLAVLMNLPLILIAFLFTLLALTFLLHRMFWPLPTRVLYALQRSGFMERRKMLRKLGVAFIVLGLSPLDEIGQRIQKLLG